MSNPDRKKRRRQRQKREWRIAKLWAKQTIELNARTPPMRRQLLLERFSDRAKDYGAAVFYGPFTEQELDEYGIAYEPATKPTEEHWLMEMFPGSEMEDVLQACKRFHEEQRPPWYKHLSGNAEI